MRSGLCFFALLLCICSGCAATTSLARPRSDIVLKDVRNQEPLSAAREAPPIQLQKVASRMQPGTAIGYVTGGLAQVPYKSIFLISEEVDDLHHVLERVLVHSGYNVVGDPAGIFKEAHAGADLRIGAAIRHAAIRVSYAMSFAGEATQGTGDGYVQVDWEVFDANTERVTFRTTTEGSARHVKLGERGELQPLAASFEAATRNLLADERFGRALRTETTQSPRPHLGIDLATSQPTSSPDQVEDVVDRSRMSVMTILTDTGHGSGFVVSSDGYVLTNEHVVANQKAVRARTATGRTVFGEVVRRSKSLDVALIKLEQDVYVPLHLSSSAVVRPGSEVYAIGAPIKESYGQSITRGIVSGFRVQEGRRFIQSDVTVNPGNSGGPLIDKHGSVIGIACISVRSGGAGIGINLFIPIEDAIAALGLETNHQTGSSPSQN